MTFDEVHDDLGTAKGPFRVVAALAVNGRLPLLEYTIKRLYQKNGCVKVICAGDLPEDRKLCESLGADWVQYKNRFLGDKWNQAFAKAKDYDPDAVVFVGSSDWICDDWFTLMKPHLDMHGFVGTAGCYMADIAEIIRLVHWPGYASCRPERADECIGIGRMLSRRLLDAIGWQPFSPILKRSLDRSMKDNAARKKFTDFMVNDVRLKSMSISTNRWENMHKFEQHWDETDPRYAPSTKMNPEPFLSTYFPEIYKIFNNPIQNENHEPQRRTGFESSATSQPNRM